MRPATGREADIRPLIRPRSPPPYGRAASSAEAAELSVLLTDDAHIRVLNRDWRDKDNTNVLSSGLRS
jgi:hypothetical protein